MEKKIASLAVALLALAALGGAESPLRDVGGRLRLAALTGDAVALKGLIARGVDVNVTDRNGRTALIEAAVAGQVDSTRILLAAGADLDRRDREWGTALDAALRLGHTEIADMLRAAGARGSGKSPGDAVCVRPWRGDGFCGVVESVEGPKFGIRISRVIGCGRGCAVKPDCTGGRPVGGSAEDALGIDDLVWVPGECLTQTGVEVRP